MTTTTSSFKPGRFWDLFTSDLKRHFGLTIFYFILQFIFFPLQYILTAVNLLSISNKQDYPVFFGNGCIYTDVSSICFTAMVIGAPIALTMLQMSYLHQKRATDLYHALPVRREKLLLAHYTAAAVMLLGPMLLNYLVIIVAGLLFGIPCFSVAGALFDMFVTFCAVLAILSIATLVSVTTGTVFDNLFYICGALFSLPAIVGIAADYMQRHLYGFASGAWMDSVLLVSPATLPIYMRMAGRYGIISNYSGPYGRPETGLFLVFLIAALVWLVLAAAFLLIALYVYRIRRSELAGKTGYNSFLTYGIKIAVSLLGGICFSLLTTSAVLQTQQAWVAAICALAGGALSYCITESILSRSFGTLRRSLPFLGAGMFLPALFVLIIGTGGMGYEMRVPDPEKVQSIEISYQDRYSFVRYDLDKTREEFERATDPVSLKNRYMITMDQVTLSEGDAKQLVTKLHKNVVERHQKGDATASGASFVITYHLKSGLTEKREYSAIPTESAEIYNQLNALPEVKRQTHPIFSLDASDVREITLMNRVFSGITAVSISESETQRLIEALREDLLAESYEQMKTSRPLGYIVLTPKLGNNYYTFLNYQQPDFVLPEGSIGFNDCYLLITESYRNTIALLTEYGYAGFDSIDYSKIASVNVSLDSFYESDFVMMVPGPRYFVRGTYQETNYDMERYVPSGSTEFTDPQEIRQLLDCIPAETSGSVVQLTYTPEDMELFGGWNTSVTLHLRITTTDGANVVYDFSVNPKAVPRELLMRLEENFSRDWDREGNGMFERIVKRIDEANETGAQNPSDGSNYLARF